MYYTTTTTVSIPARVVKPSCVALGTGYAISSCSVSSGMLSLVFKRTGFASGPKDIKVTSLSGTKQLVSIYSFPVLWKNDLTFVGKQLASTYLQANKMSYAPAPISKIVHKTKLPELK